MPQMDGFELYQEIKRNVAQREGRQQQRRRQQLQQEQVQIDRNDIDNQIKVCFITAYEIYYETLKKEFPTLDVGCFIKKPIGVKELVNKIKQELEM